MKLVSIFSTLWGYRIYNLLLVLHAIFSYLRLELLLSSTTHLPRVLESWAVCTWKAVWRQESQLTVYPKVGYTLGQLLSPTLGFSESPDLFRILCKKDYNHKILYEIQEWEPKVSSSCEESCFHKFYDHKNLYIKFIENRNFPDIFVSMTPCHTFGGAQRAGERCFQGLRRNLLSESLTRNPRPHHQYEIFWWWGVTCRLESEFPESSFPSPEATPTSLCSGAHSRRLLSFFSLAGCGTRERSGAWVGSQGVLHLESRVFSWPPTSLLWLARNSRFKCTHCRRHPWELPQVHTVGHRDFQK